MENRESVQSHRSLKERGNPMRSMNNGNGASIGNGFFAPYSWRNGYQAPPPFRATWDGTFGDPLNKVV